MSILDAAATRVFAPVYGLRHGTYSPALVAELSASQYRTEDEIHDSQWKRLQELLTFVHQRNNFYRERLSSSGWQPGDPMTPAAFARLPLLTKDDIRENRDRMITEGFSVEKMFWKRTGGSTGVPLQLYWDDEARRFKHALVHRHDKWAGYVPGVRRAALWGNVTRPSGLRQRLHAALCARTIFLDTLNMNREHLRAFVEEMRRFRPEVLFGHGHSLFVLADHIRSEGIDDIRLRGIISTAEVMPPHERRIVEQVFGPIVFDRYGCEEVSLIASECEAHDGLHVAAEGLYVEILDGDETTPGRLVITDLVNRGMPFIRYEIGDLATAKTGRCSCGRGLPRLGRVVGRTTDVLYTPDGRALSGVSILDTFTIHIPGVKQTQVVQDRLDHLIFKIVRAADFDSNSLAVLDRTVTSCFGQAMTYEVEYVQEIPLTARGKYQFSVCRIEPPTQEGVQ